MNEILEVLKDLPVGGLSFGGLVTMAIVLIFKGEIVPKSTLEAMRANYTAVIAAKDEQVNMLKEANSLSQQSLSAALTDNKELLEMGRTTVHLLESIHERADRAVEVAS